MTEDDNYDDGFEAGRASERERCVKALNSLKGVTPYYNKWIRLDDAIDVIKELK